MRQAIRTTATAGWQRASKMGGIDNSAPATDADPLQQMLTASGDRVDRRLAIRLVSAVDTLPEKQRRVIRMRFFHAPRMKLREIAMIEGRVVSSIHSRIQSGLRQIATELREDTDAS